MITRESRGEHAGISPYLTSGARIASHFLTIFLKKDFFQCSHIKVLKETLVFIIIELNFLKKFFI
jgi:hypothetical protein